MHVSMDDYDLQGRDQWMSWFQWRGSITMEAHYLWILLDGLSLLVMKFILQWWCLKSIGQIVHSKKNSINIILTNKYCIPIHTYFDNKHFQFCSGIHRVYNNLIFTFFKFAATIYYDFLKIFPHSKLYLMSIPSQSKCFEKLK